MIPLALGLELGTLQVQDPAFDRFASTDAPMTYGVRADGTFGDFLFAGAGWNRVRRGADLGDGARAAFLADTYSVGLGARVRVTDAIRPYVRADALLMRAVVRFDDDTNADDNPGELTGRALAPGVEGVGGIELRLGGDRWPVAVATTFEVGYARFGSLAFDDFGTIRPGGLVVHAGIGLRL